MQDPAPLIFKICHDAEWRDAQRVGRYDGSAKDRADGFLHFSAQTQIQGTLEKWYATATDLLVVAVHTVSLGAARKWEPSRDGALFPHLYGPLPLSAVAWAAPIARDTAGHFVLPAAITDHA